MVADRLVGWIVPSTRFIPSENRGWTDWRVCEDYTLYVIQEYARIGIKAFAPHYGD